MWSLRTSGYRRRADLALCMTGATAELCNASTCSRSVRSQLGFGVLLSLAASAEGSGSDPRQLNFILSRRSPQ